jgi:hypothetical protein
MGVDSAVVILRVASGRGGSNPSSARLAELPLARPVILGGIRVSTQMVMGIAAALLRTRARSRQIHLPASPQRVPRESVPLTGVIGVVILALPIVLRRFHDHHHGYSCVGPEVPVVSGKSILPRGRHRCLYRSGNHPPSTASPPEIPAGGETIAMLGSALGMRCKTTLKMINRLIELTMVGTKLG